MSGDPVEEELALLARIRALLAQLPAESHPDENARLRELLELREELIARGEGKDGMALHDEWHRQSSLLQQLRRARDREAVDPASPYFAHLRLRERGLERDLCLGRATRIAGELRIVDWRHAPISKLFYRYEQGEEYEEEISGQRRTGEVLVRRGVAIRDGELERVDAPEGIYRRVAGSPTGWVRSDPASRRLRGGEGAALRHHAVGESSTARLAGRGAGPALRADKRLQEITALLDPSQFELIARPGAGFRLIRGAAGSGKTTVALHRIAYQIYHTPELDSERSLVVTFSRGLRNYVAHVLPGLGVQRVKVSTVDEWMREQCARHFPQLPSAVDGEASTLAQRLKLHPIALHAIARQRERSAAPAGVAGAIDDWASARIDAGLWWELVAQYAPQSFTRDEIERFVEEQRRRNEAVFAWLDGERDNGAALDPEDEALLLRAWQLRVGPLRTPAGGPLRYAQLAIDEAQDLSPLETRVLIDCLEPQGSLTLAGDTQQQIAGRGGASDWADLLAEIGLRSVEIGTLQVAYRSSCEIMDFARALLADAADADAPLATRHGPPVESFRFASELEAIAFLAEALRELSAAEPLASVAVLGPDVESCRQHAEALAHAEVPRLRLVLEQDFAFAPGVEVAEVEAAKGLEFDYVVVVSVDAAHYPETPAARRRLHVAATRAIHQLWLLGIGPEPALLAQARAQPADASAARSQPTS